MIQSVANFGRNGVSDWLIQRFSAVILAAYTFFIVGFILLNPGLDFATWKELFSGLCVRVFSLMALLSVAAHAWIGLWGIVTDYVTDRLMGAKALPLRIIILSGYFVVTFAYVVWGVEILWGVK